MTEYNFTIQKGLTFIETVEIKTDLNQPEDLTGSTFLLQIRDFAYSAEYKISASSDNGMIAVSPVLGIVDIKLPASETDKLTSSWGVYDLIQTKPNGDKVKIIGGAVKVEPTVSR